MIKEAFNRNDWNELAHEEKGHIFPTYLYWRAVQLACKVVDCEPGVYGVWYKNNGFSWMTTKNALANSGKKIVEKLETDESFLKKIINVNITGIPKMLKDSEWFAQDLNKKNGEEIYAQWELLRKNFLKMMQYSVLGTVMEFEEPVLSNKLTKLLIDKFGEKKASQYFTELTLLTELTSAQKEQIELIDLKEQNVEEHWKKYAWVSFNYDGPGWSLEDMGKRFANKYQLAKINISKRKKEQEELEKKLRLSKKERYLFHVLRTLGFWKFERKSLNGKSHYTLENLMKEIARRHNLTLEEAKSILPSEMKQVLVDKKVDKEILKKRCKLAVAVYKGYDDYEIYTGEDALRLEHDIKESLKVDPNIKEIKGSTAYKGYAKGKAKIVNKPEDMKGFKKGYILVSASTSPEIMTAMKKAAAIVTDSGGITCHAAIIARELKVPTIIGTKFASKIIKNDEIIEVDADKGIIRKIK
ncbi:MAG: hypothetical protein KKF89_02135, partial [Nanoarchaeota archaeon]|nr:hypothetical protein [Nanoarchaeota archaeon]